MKYGLQVVPAIHRAVLRCMQTVHGEQCVMMVGASMMLQWYADSLASLVQH